MSTPHKSPRRTKKNTFSASMPISQAIEGFRLASEARRLAPTTIRNYLTTLLRFQKYITKDYMVDPQVDTITSKEIEPLQKAIRQRKPKGVVTSSVIHHFDQGSQYPFFAFGQRCREAGILPALGSVGDCFDNALCENFFATLECELLDRVPLHTIPEAR